MVVARGVHNDLIPALEGVHDVEHEARRNIKPPDIGIAARARHHAHAAGRAVIPLEGQRTAGESLPPGKAHRHLHEDHVIPGHGEIMQHARPRQIHRFHLQHIARRVRAHVGQVGFNDVITEEQHLAGVGVDARVRCHVAAQLALVVVDPLRG